MQYNKLSKIHFSPSGTTKAFIDNFATYSAKEQQEFDLLKHPPKEEVHLGPMDLVLVGMPVFAGRIPEAAAKALEKFKGDRTGVIPLVIYGNRDYDDALLELKNILEKNGFILLGAAAFIAEHSIFPSVAKGRPDAHDYAAIKDFDSKITTYINSIETAAEHKHTKLGTIKGSFPYREPASIPLKPSADSKCTKCGECAKICPAGAIPADKPKSTIKSKCVSCTACIHVCPVKARAFRGVLYKLAGWIFNRKYGSVRKEPEYYIPRPDLNRRITAPPF
ncbi:4Fe-4S dicluster domain-containing protein [Parelusimicrobium proximum]|uniref:EFR1 family ferrodoxin n=1 Tax=Parelusimicrobium proximum TaxID=3228953 RepID=UPI003D1873AF